MTTLAQKLNGYTSAIGSYRPGDGEAGLMNSIRRYLDERLQSLSAAQRKQLAEADTAVIQAAQKAVGTWEEDEMNDLVEFISGEQRKAA
jgi:hypothetical protein